MSSKTAENAVRAFTDKVKSSNIVKKQNELNEVVSGPLALARDKIQLLDTDEALTVLSKIDSTYGTDLKENVEGIYWEEIARGNLILEEIDLYLTELQDLLDALGQRINSDIQKSRCLDVTSNCYEDAKYVLLYLKLKTNQLRLQLSVSVDEPVVKRSKSVQSEFDEGEFLFRLSKLEFSKTDLSN